MTTEPAWVSEMHTRAESGNAISAAEAIRLIADNRRMREALQGMLDIAETWAVITDRKYVQPENSEACQRARTVLTQDDGL